MIVPQKSNSPEIADIFREYGSAYQTAYNPPPVHRNVMDAIVKCRTEALGGHLDEREICGYQHPFYNSCRPDSRDPKCGALAKEKWLAARKKDLLPISYFHVVFTLPDELNGIDARLCPKCKKGRMVTIEDILPRSSG